MTMRRIGAGLALQELRIGNDAAQRFLQIVAGGVEELLQLFAG